ncbi:MAG: preprotein translocase subunit SecE [Salinispira sp.]
MKRVIQFFKDIVADLKKVVWPGREEVSSSTRVVLVSITLFALALGLVDFLLANLVELIF